MRSSVDLATSNSRRGRRFSPAARHLALLALTYGVLGVAIGFLQRAFPAGLYTPPSTPSSGLGFPDAIPASAPVSIGGVLRAGAVMLSALALAVPVAWVYLITRRRKGFAQSLAHTLLMLPIAVAGIIVLVQHSTPLAFALAGLAVLRFRNTLDDTKDAIYLFVGTGIGIAAAANALDVGLALSFLFSATVIVLWWTDIGRTPAKLKAKLTLARMRETRESRIPLPPGQTADPWNALLRVHATSVEEAQAAVDAVLSETAKRWELTGVSPGEHGFQQLEYVVRLRPSAARGPLLNDLRARGTPHIVGAEFR
jgi:hypothetical protein